MHLSQRFYSERTKVSTVIKCQVEDTLKAATVRKAIVLKSTASASKVELCALAFESVKAAKTVNLKIKKKIWILTKTNWIRR